jgi:sugar lactone lactonase YvrE
MGRRSFDLAARTRLLVAIAGALCAGAICTASASATEQVWSLGTCANAGGAVATPGCVDDWPTYPADSTTAPSNPWPDAYGTSGTWTAGYAGGGTYSTDSGTGAVNGFSGVSSFTTAPASDWAKASEGVANWGDGTGDPGGACGSGYQGSGCFPYVGKNESGAEYFVWPDGSVYMHPAPDSSIATPRSALRWVSPITGSVSIEAAFNDLDPNGGDGFDYSVDQQSGATFTHLKDGIVANGSGDGYSVATLSVTAGDSIYFSVGDGGNGDYNYDSTGVSVQIVANGGTDCTPTQVTPGDQGNQALFTWANNITGFQLQCAGNFHGPEGVSVAGDGSVIVADTANNQIERWSPDGHSDLQSYGGGLLSHPHQAVDATVAGNDVIAASDSGNGRLAYFGAQGGAFPSFAAGGSPDLPSGIAATSSHLAMTDATANQVDIYDASTGAFVNAFGVQGSDPGQLLAPEGVAFDQKNPDRLWVADTGSDRIEEFDLSGNLVNHWGTSGHAVGDLSHPTGVTTDNFDNVWVADSGNDRVEEFNTDGQLLAYFTQAGSTGGLASPTSVALDPGNGDLYIADTNNNRIVRYTIPAPTAHTNPATNVAPDGQATLHGTVDTNDGPWKCHFEWRVLGQTTSYPTGEQCAGGNWSPSAVINYPGGTIEYRLVASRPDGSGESDGDWVTVRPFLADSGFRPATDGFSFANYGDGYSGMTPDDMYAVFGRAVCTTASGTCYFSTAAAQYMDAQNKYMKGGHCFGFSVLASLLFQKRLSTPFALPSQLGTGSIHDYKLVGNTLLQRQLAMAWQMYDVYGLKLGIIPRNVGMPRLVDDLVQSLNGGPDTYTLDVYDMKGGSGHAIVPYAIEQVSAGNYRVYVYDNNYPDDANRYVSIDTNNGKWSYQIFPGTTWTDEGYDNSIQLEPNSAALGRQPCVFCTTTGAARDGSASEPPTNQIILSGNPASHPSLVVTDSSGHKQGLIGGGPVEQIPGGHLVPYMGALPGKSEPPLQEVPAGDDVNLQVSGSAGADSSQLSLIGPGYDVAATGLAIPANVTDTVSIKGNGGGFSFTAGQGQPAESPQFSFGHEIGGADYNVVISSPPLKAGQGVAATLNPTTTQLELTPTGLLAGTDFKVTVTRTTANGPTSATATLAAGHGRTGFSLLSKFTKPPAHGYVRVDCKRRHKSMKCSVSKSSGTALKALGSRGTKAAALSRGAVSYATGRARQTANAVHAVLAISRPLKPGSYVLRVAGHAVSSAVKVKRTLS